MKFKLLKSLMLGVVTCISISAYAIDLDAGDYDYVPSDVNLGILYYQHAQRDALYSGSDKATGNNQLNSDIGIARYVRYMDVAGLHIAPQILVPFGQLQAKKDISAMGSSSGIGDIILANTFFIYHNATSKSTWGITPYLYLPTGKYDKDDALNIGENRYKLTLQSAYTTQLVPVLLWDVAGDVTFYGKNDDINNGKELKQDLGFQLQSSLRYLVNDQFDIRGGLSYADLGDTKRDGVKTDATTQSKFWLGTAFKPSSNTQLIATYGQDLDVENGFKENARINLRFLTIF